MTILSEIKDRWLTRRALSISQQQYLIDVALNVERGISTDSILKQTKIKPVKRGKQSIQYQTAKQLRNMQLEKACSLLEGSHYGRCEKLASIIKGVKLKLKTSDFQPVNDVERIVLQLINSGLPIPGTARCLYMIIFSEKLNSSNTSV
jgi:hypothetical protein